LRKYYGRLRRPDGLIDKRQTGGSGIIQRHGTLGIRQSIG
jgi:hypothetical protein